MTAADAHPLTLYPLGDGLGSVSLVQSVGDDKAVVNAARISFGGDSDAPLNDRDEKLIRYLLRHQHGSPFEHNLITFKIICPIFVDRQMVRHRAGVSKNEISGRYVEMQERNFTPPAFRKQAPSNRQASVEDDGTLDQAAAARVWEEAWRAAFGAYQELLRLGVTREQARGVLPLSLYTESYFTFNVRSLLHFLELRDHEGAQYETRLYARAMAQLTEPLFPVTFREWRALHAGG
ncbi:thymidylate synthase (FAD) [Deinococcus phoenicis]|uniref:Flavin-dependent thymidylate synthase n=1 Tax=Deinococcus phoenicis TaxID=1476583 RepID=A0A016QU48_9DEIO|nr:FAD-dependent thymidylate synthase [Deinococcus phoenicis]EYB69635.1 thymidylate synthase (FAD) [Deinococcus phoenicis]